MNKPGYLTTEFWLAVATSVAALLASVEGALPARWAVVAAAVSNGLYAISRGIAKA